jgi:hypothetical protein
VLQELARLWDWQHRRVALGLPPDLAPHPAAASHTSGQAADSSSGTGAAAAAAPSAADQFASLSGMPGGVLQSVLYKLVGADMDRRGPRLPRIMKSEHLVLGGRACEGDWAWGGFDSQVLTNLRMHIPDAASPGDCVIVRHACVCSLQGAVFPRVYCC